MGSEKFDKIITEYKQVYDFKGRSPDSVLCPKGRQNFRYQKMLGTFDLTNKSILDFGCGLAHLYEYLLAADLKIGSYTGVDIYKDFLNDNTARFKNENVSFVELDDFFKMNNSYDLIISVGTFNLRYEEREDENWKYISDILNTLWKRTDHALILNWMTDKVDFQQPKAFHLAPEKMINWGASHLSKRYLVDSTYMPYEYHATFFQDQAIIRPDNVFKDLN